MVLVTSLSPWQHSERSQQIMEKATKLKIVLLGPTSTGKTRIANFLSDVNENFAGDVRKTRGVRIVEFQMEDLPVQGRSLTVDIELWDCSGDRRYEPCFPVFFHDADGLNLVAAKDSPEQMKDLEVMFASAVDKSDWLATNCIVFYNNFDSDESDNSKAVKSILTKIESVEVNLEENGDGLRSVFQKFVVKIASKRSI